MGQTNLELSGRPKVSRDLDSIKTDDLDELGFYMNWKKQLADRGVYYELTLSPQLQFGTVRDKPHYNIAAFFAGEWEPSKKWKRRGTLQWYGFYYQNFNYTGEDFANDQLINVQPNDANTSPDSDFLGLGVLNWEQEFTDNMGFRVGQLFSQSIYATNPYIEDDRTSFMALPLAGPYGVNWMDYPVGLGVQYGVWWADKFEAYFGFQDANANGQYPDFNSFKNGNFVYFGEFGYYPNYGKGENEGKYSITVSLTDSPIEEQANHGYGLVLNMFQNFHKGTAVFSRYSKSFDQFSFMKSSFVVGLAFDNIPIQKENRLGVAYMFSESFEPNDRDENGIEAYWRISVLDALSFTPDVQYYLTSAKSIPNRDVFIFSMRLNWTF